MVRHLGNDPSTPCLKGRCSTSELVAHIWSSVLVTIQLQPLIRGPHYHCANGGNLCRPEPHQSTLATLKQCCFPLILYCFELYGLYHILTDLSSIIFNFFRSFEDKTVQNQNGRSKLIQTLIKSGVLML